MQAKDRKKVTPVTLFGGEVLSNLVDQKQLNLPPTDHLEILLLR